MVKAVSHLAKVAIFFQIWSHCSWTVNLKPNKLSNLITLLASYNEYKFVLCFPNKSSIIFVQFPMASHPFFFFFCFFAIPRNKTGCLSTRSLLKGLIQSYFWLRIKDGVFTSLQSSLLIIPTKVGISIDKKLACII